MGAAGAAGGKTPSAGAGGSGSWLVRAARRKLPMGRLAVLVSGGRSHIVGLADVSTTGAYIITRLQLTIGAEYDLQLVVAATAEISVHACVVRVWRESDGSPVQRRGAAVQFLEIPPDTRQRLEAFVASGPKPAP